MEKHKFGGAWTEKKLDIVQGYFKPYTTIFKGNEYAKSRYKTIYIDAFAGSGSREGKADERAFGVASFSDFFNDSIQLPLARTPQMYKGSAHLALETNPPFDKYIFIERKKEFIAQLHELKKEFPGLAPSIDIRASTGKIELGTICSTTDWNKWRAVAFLDPYGMQVDWKTITCIAETKAIDLWLLWPIGMAVNRIVPRANLPNEGWAKALNSAFGTDDWLDKFYAVKPAPEYIQRSLFDDFTEDCEDKPEYEKVVNIDGIKDYFIDRLGSVFPYVATKPRWLRTPEGSPLYLLCFASHNKTGLKIANWLLKQ